MYKIVYEFEEANNSRQHHHQHNVFNSSSTSSNYTNGRANLSHQQPRRSYSSCAEPMGSQLHQQHHVYHQQTGGASNMQNHHHHHQQQQHFAETRRCMSNRCSPIRNQTQQQQCVTSTATMFTSASMDPFRHVRDATRRSRSANCRSKSKSKSPLVCCSSTGC